MVGKNSRASFVMETSLKEELKKEAESKKMSYGELCRRKLESPPVEEEIILLRKLTKLLRNKNDKK